MNSRNVEILHIESEAVQLLPRENDLRRVAVVEFEAALRIGER